jgi:pimeloyl-ACP methyl ester carboxylesterase
MKKNIGLAAILAIALALGGILILGPFKHTLFAVQLIRTLLEEDLGTLDALIVREEHQHDEDTRFVQYFPIQEGPHPGIVLTTGVQPEGADDAGVRRMRAALAARGFAVLTIDSAPLKQALIQPKELENLAEGFRFLRDHPTTDPGRIGFVGLSVGSSLAVLAAAHEDIREEVRYIVFFAGYYDPKELIIEVLCREFAIHDTRRHWEPAQRIIDVVDLNLTQWKEAEESESARALIERIQALEDCEELAVLKEALPEHTRKTLESLSPSNRIAEVQAPLFILHGRQDTYIPYSHSLALYESHKGTRYLMLSDRYAHQLPQEFTPRVLLESDFWRVMFFANRLLGYMR